MKRTVFLLGAGAAIDWGGPTTNQITDTLIKQGPSNAKDELIINYIKNISIMEISESIR